MSTLPAPYDQSRTASVSSSASHNPSAPGTPKTSIVNNYNPSAGSGSGSGPQMMSSPMASGDVVPLNTDYDGATNKNHSAIQMRETGEGGSNGISNEQEEKSKLMYFLFGAIIFISLMALAGLAVAIVAINQNHNLNNQINTLQQGSSSIASNVVIPNPEVLVDPYYWVFDFNAPHTTDLITSNGYAKAANIENWPATHNQAVSQTLFQLELDGSNTPHHHPDAVEILFVFQGTIEAFRVEPNNGNIYQQTLTANMSVIFPRGHVHFQRNVGNETARYISNLNAERPGVYTVAQRTCLLPHDELSSLFSKQSTAAIDTLCSQIQPNPAKFLF